MPTDIDNLRLVVGDSYVVEDVSPNEFKLLKIGDGKNTTTRANEKQGIKSIDYDVKIKFNGLDVMSDTIRKITYDYRTIGKTRYVLTGFLTDIKKHIPKNSNNNNDPQGGGRRTRRNRKNKRKTTRRR